MGRGGDIVIQVRDSTSETIEISPENLIPEHPPEEDKDRRRRDAAAEPGLDELTCRCTNPAKSGLDQPTSVNS